MEIKKILFIEDTTEKYMEVYRFLRRQGYTEIDWVSNAQKAIEAVEKAKQSNETYSLVLSDMHFEFYGQDDHEAGIKTMNLFREKGYNIPVVFCSSQNWKIPGAIGNIFYNPRRDWEREAEELFRKMRKM